MRLGALCVVLVMVLVACGDNKATLAISADPASATTCDELADAVVAVNQELIDQVGDMSVEELATSGGPLSFEGWVTKAQLGAARMVELGCEDVLEGMLTERADRLQAGGPAGESLIADFIGNLPSNTTGSR